MILAKLDPQMFQELTAAHITRYLDLHKLAEFLSGAPNDKDHNRRHPLRLLRLGSSKEEPKHSIEVRSDVLNSVCELIQSLNNATDLATEGLFRKSGNITRQQQLLEDIQNNKKPNLNSLFTHDRACVLKQLIAQLPEPLLLSRHFEAFSQAINLKDNSLESGRERCLRVMQLLLLRLPRNNLAVMKSLMPFLHAVAAEPANLMDANSLAKLFAPHFLIVKNHPIDQVILDGMLQMAIDVVTFLISEAQRMFDVPTDFLREANIRIQILDKKKQTDYREVGGSHSGCSAGSTSSLENCPSPLLAYAPASSEETTRMELAKLAQHIDSLPEPKRSKLREQLLGAKAMVEAARSGKTPFTPTGRTRSKSLGSSIRKRLPFFGSSKKRHMSCEAESPLSLALHIDFNKIDESESPVLVDTSTVAKNCSLHQHSASKSGSTPAQKESLEAELALTLETMSNRCCRSPRSDNLPLPVCEKELSEKRHLTPSNRRILFPVDTNHSPADCTNVTPKKERLSRSREHRTSQKSVCSPSSRETAL